MLKEKLGDKYEFVNMDSLPMADICVECYTYNQQDYIEDAIKGFLSQKTEYSFFVVIVDDASTDCTTDILIRYAKAYPDRIKLMLSKENRFHKEGFWITVEALRKEISCYVKYFATCEGDDFWTDPMKLQIQTDYMEAHPECVMYLHNSWWMDCITGKKKEANPFDANQEKDLTISELIMIRNGHPATASRLYRKEICDAPDFVWKCSVGDYNLMLYACIVGAVHYSDRIMCTYRFMSNGSTTQLYDKEKTRGYALYHSLGIIYFLMNYDFWTEYCHHDIISVKIRFYFDILLTQVGEDSFMNVAEGVLRSYYLDLTSEFIDYIDKKIRLEKDDIFLEESLKNKVEGYDNLFIFGAGVYGKKIAKKLCGNGIDYVGYLVSEEPKYHSINGKPIWSLRGMPDIDKSNTGIIIGVIPKKNDDVVASLAEVGLHNYFNPYDLMIREVLGKV